MSVHTGKDTFLLEDGSTYHLGVKPGDVAPRIITVGSRSRAIHISALLDSIEHIIDSSRAMTTVTGLYKGTRVSIVAIGMGMPMMDFFVREAIVASDEPMAIIRVGTCGLLRKGLAPGVVALANEGCTVAYTDYAKSDVGSKKIVYAVSAPIPGDDELCAELQKELDTQNINYVCGVNNSSETFYSTQARTLRGFNDGNNLDLMNQLECRNVVSCEMESYQLYYLGHIREKHPLRTAALAIGVVNRVDDSITTNISVEQLDALEKSCALAALNALLTIKL